MKIRTITNPKLVTKKIGDGYKLYVKDDSALLPIPFDDGGDATSGLGRVISNPDFIVKIINGKAALIVRDGEVERLISSNSTPTPTGPFTIEIDNQSDVYLDPSAGTYQVQLGQTFELSISRGTMCFLDELFDNGEVVTQLISDGKYTLTNVNSNHFIEVHASCK